MDGGQTHGLEPLAHGGRWLPRVDRRRDAVARAVQRLRAETEARRRNLASVRERLESGMLEDSKVYESIARRLLGA